MKVVYKDDGIMSSGVCMYWVNSDMQERKNSKEESDGKIRRKEKQENI